MEVRPYADSDKSKREQVEEMFDNIAPKYDLLNHSLTVGIDKIWRRKAIKIASQNNPQKLLDIAAGTGDFTILEAKRTNAQEIIGIDISQNMLNVAIEKAKKTTGKPHMIILNTVKGKGVSFIEDAVPGNHSMPMPQDKCAIAISEIRGE